MSTDDNANIFPFADCEVAIDVLSEPTIFQKSKHKNKLKTKNKPKQEQSDGTNNNEKKVNPHHTKSYIYFENAEEDNNFLTLIPYTGPRNTLHFDTNLYLPQLISTTTNDSTLSFQDFIENYDQTIVSLTSSLETMSLSIYLRFGILYITQPNELFNQTISLQDFTSLRNQGKKMKTSFYTCKGVTSPKHLLTTLSKHNYHPISSNTYSYDIQLYGTKNNQYSILHFQYDEQFQCRSIYFQSNYPMNFDFIRNKTSSRFRSIDHSYSDIFDFRIQLAQHKYLSKTDPNVLDILRGVPIDHVLFLDLSTHLLHISSKLQKFVKYLKCTRSSNYQNSDEQILISIGTYEEFQLNVNCQCEPIMKASNTMTIEFLDMKNIPSGEKLYDIGMWFSTLCQTCVDLPTAIITDKSIVTSYKWFSNVSIFGKKDNLSIKQMHVNQLTTYTIQKSKKNYTSEEFALIKKILQEKDLRNLFLNANNEKSDNRKDLEESFGNIKKKLMITAAPSANEALKKVERAYHVVLKELAVL